MPEIVLDARKKPTHEQCFILNSLENVCVEVDLFNKEAGCCITR